MNSGGTRSSRARRTTLRSARRQTVLARWSRPPWPCRPGARTRAAAAVGVGRVNRLLEFLTRASDSVARSSAFATLAGSGVAEVTAEREEIALNGFEQRLGELDRRCGPGNPDGGIELIHVAVGCDPDVILGHAAPAEEAGGPFVPGAGVDGHGGIIAVSH